MPRAAGGQRARTKVRTLTQRKLREIDACLTDMKALRDELRLLLGLCASRGDGCAIIDGINEGDSLQGPTESRARKRPK